MEKGMQLHGRSRDYQFLHYPGFTGDLVHYRRQYWLIETGSYYRRDGTWKEDATQMTTAAVGRIVGTIRNLVLALIIGYPNVA